MVMTLAKKLDLTKIDKETIDRIKRVIIEFGAPIIPFTLLFQALGYAGVVGVDYGTLSGLVTTCAIELGYTVDKMGRFIILRKKSEKGAKGGDKCG
jgi:hypothetical protein